MGGATPHDRSRAVTQQWSAITNAISRARGRREDFEDADGSLSLERAIETCSRLTEEALRREQWIAVLSHDLRAPLHSIQATTRALSAGDLDEKQRSQVKRIDHAASRLATLVGETLDYAQVRLRDGGIAMQRRRCALRVVCEEAIEQVRAVSPERTIVLRASNNLEGLWDPVRIAQLLFHLVGNAISYACPTSTISVTLTSNVQGAEIAVHNWGGPIDEAELPFLFEPFRRGTHDGSNAHGLGLGLFVARAIAKAHGGGIRVSSSEHEGTTFRVALDGGGPVAATHAK
jgi:signal transduction histidine kinase